MKTYVPVLALFVLMATGCSPVEAPHGDHAHDQAVMQHEHDEDHEHAEEVIGEVKLDNGQTWEANVETTQGIEAMASIAAGYDAATGDGIVLKEELTAEFQEIFAKCTMTGEAHDQLHNYLFPLKKKLDGLGEDPSEEQMADLREYLDTYTNYFH